MAEADPQQPYDDEFDRMMEQLPYDDALQQIAWDQDRHEAQVAEQTDYDKRFQQQVGPSRPELALRALDQQVTDGAQALRDAGETTAMEVLNPDPHDDETLTRLAEREAKIRKWTAEAVELGEDADEAEARYRKMWSDADEQLAENMRDRYETYARHIENLGAQTAASLTPRENKMRGIIQRGRKFVGNLFRLSVLN